MAVLDAPGNLQIEVISKEVTILYGSQTGNGQALAEKLTKNLKAEDYQVTLSSMNEFKPNALKKIENLLLIVSTHGEGDPPDNALPFHEFLHSKRAPKLDNLQFSVLSLGDSSYEFFCQTGKQFDERLLELGAKQLSPRVDCDLDYDESAAEWFTNVLATLNEQQGAVHTTVQQPVNKVVDRTTRSIHEQIHLKLRFLENLNLNGRGSNKETRHLELSLEGSNLEFEPGDSLGIYPENDSGLVDTLIAEMGWNARELVNVNKQGELKPLREALISNFEITVLTKPLLQKAAQFTANNELKELLEPEREQELQGLSLWA